MKGKIITWIDHEGRYRIASPAYNDPVHRGSTEFDMLALVWAECQNIYNLPDNHPFFVVEDADQRERVRECAGLYFRYPISRPTDRDVGSIRPEIIEQYAWEMDVDGRPKVNMLKAQNIHMDYIRAARVPEFDRLDKLQNQARGSQNNAEVDKLEVEKQTLRNIPQTFDLSGYATPITLLAAWPVSLPPR